MDANERRLEILKILKGNEEPVKGTSLAQNLQVSRQVIVQDIALLRAGGEEILATPQGYLLPSSTKSDKIKKTIVCHHNSYEEIEDELKTIVDLGGKIIDVTVEHPLYGEITSQIQVGSRHDLKLFMQNLKETKAEPLSSLTEGVHLHNIEVPDEDTFYRIKKSLKEKKYLITDE